MPYESRPTLGTRLRAFQRWLRMPWWFLLLIPLVVVAFTVFVYSRWRPEQTWRSVMVQEGTHVTLAIQEPRILLVFDGFSSSPGRSVTRGPMRVAGLGRGTMTHSSGTGLSTRYDYAMGRGFYLLRDVNQGIVRTVIINDGGHILDVLGNRFDIIEGEPIVLHIDAQGKVTRDLQPLVEAEFEELFR